jgi:hypothetical protein
MGMGRGTKWGIQIAVGLALPVLLYAFREPIALEDFEALLHIDKDLSQQDAQDDEYIYWSN